MSVCLLILVAFTGWVFEILWFALVSLGFVDLNVICVAYLGGVQLIDLICDSSV